MKKFILFIVSVLFFSCSSDNEVEAVTDFCNEQVVDYYSNDVLNYRNVKNNAIIVEFDYNVSNKKITEILTDLNLFKLPLNNEGELSSIYVNVFSTKNTKMVLCYFKEGSLSCEKLNNQINQIQNIDDVFKVSKLYQGTSAYSVVKEGNYIEVKLNTESELTILENIANQHGFLQTEYEPNWNDTEYLVYYLIDNSGKKSVIEMSKIVSESILYQYIKPSFISFQQ